MKMQLNRLLAPLHETELVQLTTEVKETLATDHLRSDKRVLSSAELWDIQRHKRARVLRRFL